jgi:hypothetical protein
MEHAAVIAQRVLLHSSQHSKLDLGNLGEIDKIFMSRGGPSPRARLF